MTRQRARSHRGKTESSSGQAPVRKASGTRARVRPETPTFDDGESEGYDANEESPDQGLASKSISVSDILDSAAADADDLSVNAEDLGAHALREAAQQDDWTSRREITEEEAADTLRDRSGPEFPSESQMEPPAVDLTDNTIRNGSLFDQPPTGELDQSRPPLIKTNEVDETLERNERARRARKAHR